MGKYFVTDVFCGEANKVLTADHAYKIGRYLGWYYNQNHRGRIIIGKDTRRSSYRRTRGNAIKPVVRSFVRQLSCCQISDILNSKSQKQVCQKDRCCPSAKKKDIQLQNLPISKMNCADSTERPLKLPEPVFHCVDIFHHQPDNIDVPSGIPAHEELSGCF